MWKNRHLVPFEMAHDFIDIHMDLADMTHAFLVQQLEARQDNTLEAWV